MCDSNMLNDPYGHLMFYCNKTLQFINTDKLYEFIFKNTGKYKNWLKHNSNSTILYKIPLGTKKDQEINPDYKLLKFHPKHFTWNYKAIDFDLNRCYAYRNLMALITHNIWIWICNQIYSENPIPNQQLNYEYLKSKWLKLASLEYIKKTRDYILKVSKTPFLYNHNLNEIFNDIKTIRKSISDQYCIKSSKLPQPNVISSYL